MRVDPALPGEFCMFVGVDGQTAEWESEHSCVGGIIPSTALARVTLISLFFWDTPTATILFPHAHFYEVVPLDRVFG